MNEIFWPQGYIPGETDNFASNEIIVKGLSAEEVWPYLENGSRKTKSNDKCSSRLVGWFSKYS